MSSSRPLVRRLFPFVPAAALLVVAVLVSVLTEVSVGQLTRDTTAVARIPSYTGAISTLGLMLWSATAAVCFFASYMLRREAGSVRIARFLLASGLLTTALLIDDAFLLHENAGRIGGSSQVVIIGYVVAAGVLFWTYRDIVRASEPVLLLVAGALFICAVGSDALHDLKLLHFPHPDSRAIVYVLEDGLKFLGIVGWLNYYTWTSLGYLRKLPRVAV